MLPYEIELLLKDGTKEWINPLVSAELVVSNEFGGTYTYNLQDIESWKFNDKEIS